MALKGLQILYNLILKSVAKESGQASGILSIGKDIRNLADKKLQRYVEAAKKQGVNLDNLSEQEAKYMLELNKPKAPKVLSNEEAYEFLNQFLKQGKKDKGEVVKFPKDKIKDVTKAKSRPPETEIIEGIETTKGLGDVFPKQIEKTVTVRTVIEDIKKLDPIESMKETNKVLKGEGKYKNLSKADREKIAGDESVTDHIFERNIIDETEDFSSGGKVKESWTDKLVRWGGGPSVLAGELGLEGVNQIYQLLQMPGLYNKGGRAGIGYLLAEDTNERMPLNKGGGPDRMMTDSEKEFDLYMKLRDKSDYEKFLEQRRKEMEQDKKRAEEKKYGIPVADGGRIGYAAGGMGRRAFLKLMAALGLTGTAAKYGLPTLFKKATPKVAKEVVKSAGSGQPPPYFFNLVNKIKTMGDDVTPQYAAKERERVIKYKDFELTEDITTGEKTIKKTKSADPDVDGPPNMTEETYMNYKPGKGQMDETTKGKTPPDEYTEDTTFIRNDRENTGEIYDTVEGVADDVIEEGTMFEDNITDFGK
jgi:hypothetical protein